MIDGTQARRAGLALLVATGVVGALGYVMQILAGLQLSAADYATFAVVWAGVFGLAGALAGLQQEIARSAAPGLERGPRPWVIALATAAVPTAAFLAAAVADDTLRSLLVVVAFGAVGSSALLVVTGLAYAAHAWQLVITAMVLEAVARLVMLELALLLRAPLPLVVLALVAPFAITAVVVAPAVARASRGHGLGVSGARLAVNLARTLTATTSSAIVVSGFPLFLEQSEGLGAQASIGAFLFAFTLSRAPFVIVFLALQSFLIKVFQARLDHVGIRFAGLLAGLVGVVAAAALVAALIGPSVLRVIGADYVIDGGLLFWIVLSAAPMSLLALSGPLVLAAGRRSAYAVGWVVAAVVSVVGVLLLPGDVETAALVAISVGPAIGAAVHLGAFARRR